MAVYSMTGYASASNGAGSSVTGTPAMTLEMRSVNSRFLDLVFRLPDELRGMEAVLRETLAGGLRRGKVDVRLSTQATADAAWPEPTPEQLNRLAALEGRVQSWLPQATGLTVNEALHWCRNTEATPSADDAQVLALARECLDGLRAARAREGERLVAMLLERVARLRDLAATAEPLVPAVVARQLERFTQRWREALQAAGAGASVSEEAVRERALAEAAAYALRVDVAEELDRLRAHLDEVTRLLERGGEVGKRLDFLIQELLREANTLGSKAAALELTQVAVDMKVAIEQMREQVQNLE